MRGSRFAKFAFALLTVVAVALLLWLAFLWLPTLIPSNPRPQPSNLSPSQTTSPSDESSPGAHPTPSVEPPSPAPTATSGTGREPVYIELVFAGWIASDNVLEVSGYTSTVVETGGTCTVTAAGSAGNIVVSRDAFKDRTVTTCGTIDIPAQKLENGDYDVTLAYKSPGYEGVSVTKKVQVVK